MSSLNAPDRVPSVTQLPDRSTAPALAFVDVSKRFASTDGRPLEVLRRVSFDLPENACLLTLEHARLIGRPEPAVGTSVHVPHEPGPLGI